MKEPRVLLVVGLTPKTANSEYLYGLFGEFGALRQVRIGRDDATRGSAIVIFEQCEAAERAVIALNGFSMGNGRTLRVLVYDETRDKRALERRKRARAGEAEYRQHQVETGAAA